MMFNDPWFDDSDGHKLFVMAHEFRHTMYVNSLYSSVNIDPRYSISGYEELPVSKYRVPSRNHEGEARIWAAEVVGYSEFDK